MNIEVTSSTFAYVLTTNSNRIIKLEYVTRTPSITIDEGLLHTSRWLFEKKCLGMFPISLAPSANDEPGSIREPPQGADGKKHA